MIEGFITSRLNKTIDNDDKTINNNRKAENFNDSQQFKTIVTVLTIGNNGEREQNEQISVT